MTAAVSTRGSTPAAPSHPHPIPIGDRARGRSRGPGRPRDEGASRAILAAALRQVDALGYGRMSVESVAAEAGVSRASVYRRFRDKADLVTAAIARTQESPGVEDVDDPRAALTAFLEQFDARFAESCLEVLGSLAGERGGGGALARHRQRVIEPRMGYARALLELARGRGELAPDADLEVALHMLAGSVLSHRVCGATPGPGWARRAVDTVWAGVSAERPSS